MGAFGILLLGVLLTVIFYMAFPLIKLVINHGKFEKKVAKKIALWNSIVVGVIFFILTFSLEAGSAWSGAPAVLYYWINCSILTDKKSLLEAEPTDNNAVSPITKDIQTPQTSGTNETSQTCSNYNVRRSEIMLQKESINIQEREPTTENLKIQFCRRCGNKLSEDSVFCNKCGTKIIV